MSAEGTILHQPMPTIMIQQRFQASTSTFLQAINVMTATTTNRFFLYKSTFALYFTQKVKKVDFVDTLTSTIVDLWKDQDSSKLYSVILSKYFSSLLNIIKQINSQ